MFICFDVPTSTSVCEWQTPHSDLEPIMSITKSFDKHPSAIKIKCKAFESSFHFRKIWLQWRWKGYQKNLVAMKMKRLSEKSGCSEDEKVIRKIWLQWRWKGYQKNLVAMKMKRLSEKSSCSEDEKVIRKIWLQWRWKGYQKNLVAMKMKRLSVISVLKVLSTKRYSH